MNNADAEYFKLLNLVINKGRTKKNRTGQDTLGVFGAQARFDLSEGFPLLTTKRVSFHNILHELLWFLSGSTNIGYLVDNNVNIWNADCYKRYTETCKVNSHQYDEWLRDNGNETLSMYSFSEFQEKMKGKRWAERWGDLGEGAYGNMWREFPYSYQSVDQESFAGCSYSTEEGYVDQISKLIESLRNNPDSRRHIVTAWHPHLVETVVLPPCHVLFQFHTEELTAYERYDSSGWITEKDIIYQYGEERAHLEMDTWGVPRRRLNCQLYQRSADLFLGVPYNIASYALLTHMVAQVVGMVPGEFIHTFGDLHLYKNHLPQVAEQLSREPLKLPKLKLDSKISNIFDFTPQGVKLEGYESHPAIKAELSV